MKKSIIFMLIALVAAFIAFGYIIMLANSDLPLPTIIDLSGSLKNVADTPVVFGGLTAYATTSAGYNYVMLENGGQQTTIEKAPNDYVNHVTDTLSFYNVRFSPSGNFIAYQAGGWEWFYTHVYDLKSKKIKPFASASDHGFSKYEKDFYACADNSMTGDFYANIYSLPDFKVKQELMKLTGIKDELVAVTCRYDYKKNLLTATFACVGNPEGTPCDWVRKVEYDFASGKATVIK